jgi:ELWxxDGT repeat protein
LAVEPLEDRCLLSAALVRDIAAGSFSSSPADLANVNGTLFFAADDGTSGVELWRSNGTAVSTFLVKDINPAGNSSNPTGLTNVNGTLFFAAADGTTGRELWKSDGTPAGTVLVKDLEPEAGSSNPEHLINVNGTLFFTAAGGLWKSDGTLGGTVLVKDVSATALTDVNGTLFFTVVGFSSVQLWKSNGTTEGTVRITEFQGAPGIPPVLVDLTNVNGTLFFGLAVVEPLCPGGCVISSLLKSDGTLSGTTYVKVFGVDSLIGNLTNVNGTLFFTAGQGSLALSFFDLELWKSDGSPAGTVLVKDINPGIGASNPHRLTNVNGTLFFAADDGTTGTELWKSNGTAAGTVLVRDINAGSGSSHPANLTNLNGTLFFTAESLATGRELWRSSGTALGTVVERDINPGGGSSDPLGLTTVNGALFFSAADPTLGRELWRSDGSTIPARAPTATGITASANPSGLGQLIVFTATVAPVAPGTGIPTGTVTFTVDGTPQPASSLSGGLALFATSTLTLGNHTITATYNGDGSFAPGTSAAYTQMVGTQPATTTMLLSTANPSLLGQPVTFFALVNAVTPVFGTPTGTVILRDGATPIGIAALSSGLAIFTTANLPAGFRAISAAYTGDAIFNASTSPAITQVVIGPLAASTTRVVSLANPSTFGQPVTFTATVSAALPASATPTGPVVFRDGDTTLGIATLTSSGQATFTTSSLSVGSHTITAFYGGDGTFTASTSAALAQTVNPAASTTVVTSPVNPSVLGQEVTFTVIVTAGAPATGTPTGIVILRDGEDTLGSASLVGGSSTFTVASLSVGNHPISAVYLGDSTFTESISGVLTQTVNPAATTTTLVSSGNPSTVGQAVTLTATVAAVAPGSGTPTGTVTFWDSDTFLGTAPLSGGTASVSVSSLALGSHAITAVYSGSGDFTGSTSAVLIQTVRGLPSTVTSLFCTPNPVAFGGTVTLIAIVSGASPSGATPTGRLTFRAGTTTLGTAPILPGGVAFFFAPGLPRGSHLITATYEGDASFATSLSMPCLLTVL